ncbi:MAG: VOC family protein [Kineosporiaceae bacterium]
MPAISDVRTVGVPVSDQDRALDFYVGVLGLEKRVDAPFGHGRWVEVAPSGAVTSIALVAAPDAPRTAVDLAVRFTTADADADRSALAAAGVDVDDAVFRVPGVPAMFTLRDVDGNTVVLVERELSI